jgi:hypothetical protein
MLRSSLTLAGLVALGAAAQAQQAIPSSRVHPITGTVRDAGVLNVATGTWTRRATQVNIGADIIYNNTAPSGYFSGLSSDTYNDEGRIPSPSSPTNLSSRPGCNTSYTIDGIQIDYCTDEPTGGDFNLAFFETYAACTSAIGLIPTATISTLGAPGSPATGTLVCWNVTLDLAGMPSTAFAMQADGDGTYVAPESANLFGWSISSTLAPAMQANTGPTISGDPSVAARFDGTIWDSPVNLNEDGTGMGSVNQFYIENGMTTTPGCYFFGALPLSSFHLELYATACAPMEPGVVFCPGDGTGTACPCANNGAANNGCANSVNAQGVHLGATGTASIAGDTVQLLHTGGPNSSVLFFQGTTQLAAGAGSAFGDGKRCAGGTIIRLGTKNAAGGAAQYPEVGDQPVAMRGQVMVPGTRTYQSWYRNAAAFCTSSTFNLSNGYEIAWGA